MDKEVLEDVSLVDYISEDAPTIEDLLVREQQEHGAVSTRLRTKYMHRVRDSMHMLKSILGYPVSWWSTVQTYRTRRKHIHARYCFRCTEHATYVQLTGNLHVADLTTVLQVERDSPIASNAEQWQEYDCNGLGVIRVASATCSGCSPLATRSVVGLEWDRVRLDAQSAILLFQSLDPVADSEVVVRNPESVFYGIYANPHSVTIAVRLPHAKTTWWFRLLFRLVYIPRLMQRFDQY